MSTFYEIDSRFRDREEYPNPFNFQVDPKQILNWFSHEKTVSAFHSDPGTMPLEFATSVKLKCIIIPYVVDPNTHGIPKLYIEFKNYKAKDTNLIYSINNTRADENFVAVFDKYQDDNTGTRVWIHYKSDMDQVMRFNRNDPIIFIVKDNLGNILPNVDSLVPLDPNLTRQVYATFETVPYIKDQNFRNSIVDVKK